MRTFLALVAQLSWPVCQFDVKFSFLNGELEEEVYISQPEGFVINSQEDKVYCVTLNKPCELSISKLILTFMRMVLKKA